MSNFLRVLDGFEWDFDISMLLRLEYTRKHEFDGDLIEFY